MWPFSKAPEDLAKRGKPAELLDILTERLGSYRDLNKQIAAASVLGERKKRASSLFRSAVEARTGSGEPVSSLGLAARANKVCDLLINQKDEDGAVAFGTAICPFKDAELRSVLRRLLLSDLGWKVWRALCGREGPEVLEVVLPLIPDYARIDHGRIDCMLEDLEYSFRTFDKTLAVPAGFLIPLIFDRDLQSGHARLACRLLRKFMTPATMEERVLAALLEDPVDQGALDRLGAEAIPHLRKFKEALETDLPNRADVQLKRFDAPVTVRDRMLSLLANPTLGARNAPAMGAEEGDVLLEFMAGESAHKVAELLVAMRYPRAAVPVLKYFLKNLCREYSQLVHSGSNRRRVDEEFRWAVQAFGPHGRVFLEEVAQDKACSVLWAETFGSWAPAFAPGREEGMKAVSNAAQEGLRSLSAL